MDISKIIDMEKGFQEVFQKVRGVDDVELLRQRIWILQALQLLHLSQIRSTPKKFTAGQMIVYLEGIKKRGDDTGVVNIDYLLEGLKTSLHTSDHEAMVLKIMDYQDKALAQQEKLVKAGTLLTREAVMDLVKEILEIVKEEVGSSEYQKIVERVRDLTDRKR